MVTASRPALWVLAQRASWLRLLPIRASSRVRACSTSTRAAVQVRDAAEGAPDEGERAAGPPLWLWLARLTSSAGCAAEREPGGFAVWEAAWASPRGAIHAPGWGLKGEPLISPNVQHWVGWLSNHL